MLAVIPTIAATVVARLAAFAHRRPYGLVFQDLIGLAATQSGVVGGHRIAGVVARAEIALARNAEGVGVITNGFGTYLRARGVAPSRITRLRNWSQDVTPTRSREEVRLAFGWGNDTFVCVHAGNIGHKQGLENVLAAAGLLRARPILFVLAGDGNERPRLERLAAERQLTNVVFLPPSPPGEYEALLRAADLLLVNQRASVGEMSLASKLTSYFAAGRPVLAAVAPASETARELTNANGGLLVAPDDPDALADAVGRLAGNEQQAAAYQDNSLEYVRTRLAPQVVLPEYEKFVAKLARRAP